MSIEGMTADEWSQIEDRVRRAARAISRRFFVVGMDEEDVEAELVLHAWKIRDSWRPDAGKSLVNYLGLCMTRHCRILYTAANAKSRGGGDEPEELEAMLREPGRQESVIDTLGALDTLHALHARLLEIRQHGVPTPASTVMEWLIDHPDSLGDGGEDALGRASRGSSVGWYADCQRDTGCSRNQIIAAMATIRRVAKNMPVDQLDGEDDAQ